MTHLSLFAGIGGIDLGLDRAGSQCVGMVEIDPFCRAVLAKNFPGVPLFQDVRSFDARAFAGSVDLVAGGFPCQDISVAGKGAGIDGARSGLWSEMLRVVREVRPAWVLAENVPALRTRGADRVLGDLEGEGYACWPLLVGAGDVGAPHRRQRVWIVAHARERGRMPWLADPHEGQPDAAWRSVLAHRARDGQRGQRPAERADGLRAGPSGDAGVADTVLQSSREPRHGQPPERQADPGRNGEDMADPPRGGLRADGGARGDAGHADERGESLADAAGGRCGETRGPAPSTQAGPADARSHHAGQLPGRLVGPCGGTVADAERHDHRPEIIGREAVGAHAIRPAGWPARPGEPQHEWEAPRLVELPMGGTVDGIPARLVRAANRHALRAFGNSVVPQVVELVGRVIVAAHAEREGRAVA